MKILSNSPFARNPTIIIKEDDSLWPAAYENWISGKNPTDSPEWTKGVFMNFED